MKLRVALIIIVFVFTKCSNDTQAQIKKLSIPDSVSVSINNGQIQISGTNAFMLEPEGFNFNSSKNRLEYNDSTYIYIVETPTVSYKDKRDRFVSLIKEENTKGFQTYYQKEFIFQNKNAIILYGLDKTKTTEQIILLFGDSVRSTMLFSRFRANDQKNRNEILKSLLSTYKSDSAIIDISSIQNFSVDMLNTKFKYNSTDLHLFLYPLNGVVDPGSDANTDEIIIGQMPAMENENLIKDKALSMIENFKKVGIDISDYKQDKIYINNLNAYEITITGKLKNRKIVIYEIVTSNNNTSILFEGFAFDNYATYLQQFKQIAQTLRLK